MRSLGLIGLLLALLVVGVLVKKQMAPVAPAAMAPSTVLPGANNVRTQSEQIQQQVRESLDAAARALPVPDDAQ